MDSIASIKSYIDKENWRIKENSNMDYSLQGLNNHITSEIMKNYWLTEIYTLDIYNAHHTGDIHIHDLGLLSVYCVGWDLQDILLKGFKGVPGKVEALPPRHFRSALGQIVNFFYTLQGEAAGAQAISNFDTLLAPFVWSDNLEWDEVKQALQEFVFNLNIPTRVGFQTPFTNITMDLTVSSIYKDTQIIIGGEYQAPTYSDFQKEMDMINSAFASVMLDGDANDRVFTFPIPTYNITKDFDWDNLNLENLWKLTGKYGIPYFSNFVDSAMSPDDARSMCCRLRLDKRELHKRGGGLFGANPLTGSIGVVTINLPRIGYHAVDLDMFFFLLKKYIHIAKESLIIKRKILEDFTEKGLYPYSKFYLNKTKGFWDNHFSTIGVIGMNEACLNFKNTTIETNEGFSFAKEVMQFIRDELQKIQNETGTLFNLEATPAEGSSYSLAKKDKEFVSEKVICANEEGYQKDEAPFYTNSTQSSIKAPNDLFESIELQEELQTMYTGGTVHHIYLGEQIRDTKTVKSVVKKVTHLYRLPYFTLTPTFSICPFHGYLPGEQYECGLCGRKTEVYSRVVGYMRPVQQWNVGKQAEFKTRKNIYINKL
jgi:ribonucleoside-triphosphate reductase